MSLDNWVVSCRNDKATVHVLSTVTPTICYYNYQSTNIKTDTVQFSCVLKLDKKFYLCSVID